METAKTGSKLAQLQALRGQKQRRQALGRIVHALHSSSSVTTLEAEISELKAEIKRLKQQLAGQSVTKAVTVTRPVTCPKCGAALGQRKTAAERMRAMRARRKQNDKRSGKGKT